MADTTDDELQKWIDKWDACNQGKGFPKAPEPDTPGNILGDDPFWKEISDMDKQPDEEQIINEGG